MNFLFVNLEWQGFVSKKTYKIHVTVPPLDLILLYDSAVLRGHQAKIFDCFVEDAAQIKPHLDWADWLVVTTTPYHMWQCPNSEWNWITEAIKKLPTKKIILVGLHSSVFPEQTLRETGVYAVIRREPEVVFRSFLEKGRWEDCEGVSYLAADGQYKENSPPKLPHMDELAVKNYNVDISKYGYFLLGNHTGVFESSRGCPWKCTFCDQEMYSWKYRTKTPQVFAEEVLNGLNQTAMKTAYFYDLEFTVADKRTFEICDEFIRLGINKRLKWAIQTRADMINEPVLEALKSAGCKLIHFGVESANPEILKATNKRITRDKIEAGVKMAKKAGFQTACFFMFGLPEERPDQFDNTLEFARSLNPTYASFHFSIPFPGTPLYSRYIEEKGLKWGAWPATYFDGWPHEQITSYLRNAYRKFYLFPKRIEPRQFMFRLENLPQKLKYFASVN